MTMLTELHNKTRIKVDRNTRYFLNLKSRNIFSIVSELRVMARVSFHDINRDDTLGYGVVVVT